MKYTKTASFPTLKSRMMKTARTVRCIRYSLIGAAFFLGVAVESQSVMAQGAGPDGKIVYSPDGDEIFVTNADGSGTPTNLTSTPGDAESDPVWSPDGTRIAYVRYFSVFADVWIMNADGTGQTNLTRTSDIDEYSPTWCPDGKKLAFVRVEQPNNWGIFVMDADGANVESLTNDIQSVPEEESTPAWSPLGNKIAFSAVRDGKRRITLMNTDGSGQETLSSSVNNDWDQNPSWSPDGSKLTFMRALEQDNFQWDVFVMNADGTGQTNLTQHPSADMYPTFSPDGTEIAFRSTRDTFVGDIYRIAVPASAPATTGVSAQSVETATVALAAATSPAVTRLHTNGAYGALDWQAQAAATVSVADFAFTPATLTIQQGQTVNWIFKGPNNHTVSDSTGIGLFDSGITAPGSTPFTVTFPSAGSYPYMCQLHPTMRGTVRVPMNVSPATGNAATQFTITWSSVGAPNGFVFDIQVKRPGASSFVDWKLSRTRRRAVFTSDAGAGRYSFRARLRKLSNGAHSGYSPARRISVQ